MERTLDPTIAVNPFRCRMWGLHDRLDDHISEVTCRAEISSFQQYGQLVPVLGRRLQQGSDHDIELIYGARRLFVARHLNCPLVVELRNLSDKQAIIAMDLENRHRRDISPYERGLSYARWLCAGHFRSQEDIARALKVSASQVSRLLKLARLPSIVVDAFGGPLNICEGWGLELVDAAKDLENGQRLLQVAHVIANEASRPVPQELYRLLVTSMRGGSPKAARSRVVRAANGAELFRVKQHRDSIALILPVECVSARALSAIERTVAHIIQGTPGSIQQQRWFASAVQRIESKLPNTGLHAARPQVSEY